MLSPTYDMLPMLYAPVGGELVARDWDTAKTLATRFWQAAAEDARVSAGFRAIAADN